MSLDREALLDAVMNVEKQLSRIQDFDILLERLLTEARLLINADAGSIYVHDDAKLYIKYAQNDTLQAKLGPGQKLPFVFAVFPVNQDTVAGLSVSKSMTVNIPYIHALPTTMPYGFNTFLGTELNYQIKSMLTVPLYSSGGGTLGVLQIINALDHKGNVVPFDDEKQFIIEHFALSASAALERAYLTRTMVLRMVAMARFRDPTETSLHAARVSSYAVEIYDRWAFHHHIAKEESEKFRDALKIAATLHDVGKVGIPDNILKKQGKLTDSEYEIIKDHTRIGASLFEEVNSAIDRMSREVTLFHHERWDGTGYPNAVEREAIPLSARIVCLADVFDALSSRRIYKKPWDMEKVLEEIRKQHGQQFDPDLTDCFFEALPRILEIRSAIPDSVS
jgi:hypothetical protein